MNKAFVREPDDTGQRFCPRCGSLGITVTAATWQAQVTSPESVHLAEPASFCPFAQCEVVYFDEFERVALVEALAKPVYPKDPDAPLCGCFGLTTDDIDADLSEGGVGRLRELLAKSKSPDAHCKVMSPSGQCCVPEAQRYYMKRRGGA
jgi:hypothetical protein